MPDLLSGPTVITFPLWKGQDTYFVVNRRDPNTGNLIDYDENTSAKVVFTSGKNEVEFSATIVGSQAQFLIDDASVADVKNNSTWRLQFTIDGRDKSPVIGKVSRKDAL